MGLTNKKITKTIYITPAQNQALDKLSRVTRVPQSEFIREGIELILKHYDKIIREEEQLFLRANNL